MRQINIDRAKTESEKKNSAIFFRRGKVGAYAEQFTSQEKLREWNSYVEQKLQETQIEMPFE